MNAARKSVHVDFDAFFASFFASVEQRHEPRYWGKPIVVGVSRQLPCHWLIFATQPVRLTARLV
jgi:nucleotidyltransferase/DNA polymerase involved in DNA repair